MDSKAIPQYSETNLTLSHKQQICSRHHWDRHMITLKLWNRVENVMAKGETAHDEQFLLLPLCFLKASFTDVSKTDLICIFYIE